MTDDREFDAAVDRLSAKFGEIIRAHYVAGPTDQKRVFEVLNALAINAAHVIVGCEDIIALRFFDDALVAQIDQNVEDSSGGEAAKVLRTSTLLKSFLTRRPPQVVGGILADLLSIFIAGHIPMAREEILTLHFAMVRRLIPESEKELFPNGLPEGWSVQ